MGQKESENLGWNSERPQKTIFVQLDESQRVAQGQVTFGFLIVPRGGGRRGVTNCRWDEVSNEKLHRGMEMSVKFE